MKALRIALAGAFLACGIARAAAAPTAVPPPLTGSKKTVENAGVVLAAALPLVAGGIALYHDDDRGLAQGLVDLVATVGTAYVLKEVVRERRPDGSDYHSFPSDTAALAFAPAQFVWDRYGWQWGVPAYAAASFVAYSRVDADKHHWYDVTASAALAFTYSKIFTTGFREHTNIYASPTPGGAQVNFRYDF